MKYNFNQFIDDLAKASGQYALCEAIKNGYKVCCEATSHPETEYLLEIQKYFNKPLDKYEFKNEVEDAGLLIDYPDAIEAEKIAKSIASMLEVKLKSIAGEVYPEANEGVYLVLANRNAVQIEVYVNAVKFQLWHNATKVIPFGGNIMLADPDAIQYDIIGEWLRQENAGR